MEITPIDTNFSTVASIVAPSFTQGAEGSVFDTVMSEIGRVNDKLVGASNELRNLATGDSGNLHGAMIAMESARLDFQLLLQVRNHFMDAYQDLMRMQV